MRRWRAAADAEAEKPEPGAAVAAGELGGEEWMLGPETKHWRNEAGRGLGDARGCWAVRATGGRKEGWVSG